MKGYTMSNKSKIIYISIAAIVVCAVVGFIIFSLSGKKYEKTVFIGNYKYSVNDGKITVSSEDEKVKKQSVKVLYDKKIIDGYIKTESEGSSALENNLHIYSNDKKLLSNDQYVFAYTSDLKLTIIGFNTEYIDELSDMIPLIKQIGLDIKTVKPDYFVVNSFDIDEDGVVERIYTVGLSNKGEYLSDVIMEKDGKYYTILSELSSPSDDETTIVSLFAILDFNDDGNYEYVVSKSYSEFGTSEYELYNFDGTTFNRLILQ